MYNVLIVDDEPDICLGLSEIIDWNEAGFNVLDTATDGEEALEKFSLQKYDLLITDIRMPVISGLDLIKKIREKNLSMKIIILSGYNDFKFAKKAIEYAVNGYLLKPIDIDELTEYLVTIKDELDKELEEYIFSWNNINLAKNRLLLDLATGSNITPNFNKKINSYEISLKGGFFNIALIEIDNLYSMLDKDFVNANLIFAVKNIAEEIISANKMGYVYEDTNGTIGIIFNGAVAALTDEKLIECLQLIRSNVLNYIKLNITIGYGETVSSIFDIKLSHKQAKQAIELRSITDKGGIIPYKSSYPDSNTLFDIRWKVDNLLAAIERLSEAEVMAEIKLLVQEISQKKFTVNITKIIFYNIFFDIGNLPKKYNFTDNNFSLQQEIMDLNKDNKTFTLEHFEKLLVGVCIKTCNFIREFQTSKRSNVVDKIQRYIKLHYAEDLSLKSISNIFYMNPVYLGRLFKNDTGDSFTDYVNKIRISEAKKMFFMDSSNISGIIEKLGFNNPEYFYRLFPKYEGITFAEYKKTLQKNINFK